MSELRPLNQPLMVGLAGSLPTSELSLLDLADRLLNRGVVVAGEATISVAGIDLIYLGLNLVLASVETLRAADERTGRARVQPLKRSGDEESGIGEEWNSGGGSGSRPPTGDLVNPGTTPETRSPSSMPMISSAPVPHAPTARSAASLDLDPEHVEEGLARLVLTVVELIRQLLERQAIRRMEGGSLSDEEIERLGVTLKRLQEKLYEMAAAFGLQPDDLNINLGPLGNLL